MRSSPGNGADGFSAQQLAPLPKSQGSRRQGVGGSCRTLDRDPGVCREGAKPLRLRAAAGERHAAAANAKAYPYAAATHDATRSYSDHRTGAHRPQAQLVANIVPNEIAPEPELAALPLLPQLAPIIEPAAEKYGLDSRLVAAVIWVESSGDPNAVSRKGAKGLMQLMPETARSLGVTDVLDPAQNVDGGARYLKQQIDDHRDLSLALAAYNAGPTTVSRHGGIPPYKETKNYVRRVLALYREAGGNPGEAASER